MAENDEELEGTHDDLEEQGRTDSQEDAGGTGEAQDATTDTQDDDDPRVKRANRDAARYRRELREEQQARRELEERLERLEGKGKGDTDAAAELEEERRARSATTERLRRVSARAEIAAQAAELRLADPDTALALLRDRDPELKALEWENDEPTPESVRDALEDLLERKPFLRAEERAPGTARSGTGSTAGGQGTGGKPPKETDDQRRARLRGGDGSSSIWDPETAKQRGGGVVGV